MPKTIGKFKIINTPIVLMDSELYPKWHIFGYLTLDLYKKKAVLTRIEVFQNKYLDKFLISLKVFLKSYGIKQLEICTPLSSYNDSFFPHTPYWFSGPVECNIEDITKHYNLLDIEQNYVHEFRNIDNKESIIKFYLKENYKLIPNLFRENRFDDSMINIDKEKFKEWKLTPLRFYPIELKVDYHKIEIEVLQVVSKVKMQNIKIINAFNLNTFEV